MNYIIIAILILAVLVGCSPVIVVEPEPTTCAEFAQLQVVYDGRYLTRGEVIEIPFNTKVLFRVQGFDITCTLDACLDGSEITWGNSCSCTHWVLPTGIENLVYVNNGTLNMQRDVWVHHVDGQSFSWKIEVI